MKTGDRYGGRMKIYKPLKYKLMKKIILSLTLLLVGSISYSQSFSNVDVGKHKEYMMKTYKLDSKKADVIAEFYFLVVVDNESL